MSHARRRLREMAGEKRSQGLEQASISRYLSSDLVSVPPTTFRLLKALGLELTLQAHSY